MLALIIAVFVCAIKPAQAQTKTILAFGDSLTAGLGLPASKAFPAQLEEKLRTEGYDIKIINAGVSGDTTGGGLARLEFSLTTNPDFVILELGANDMMRAIALDHVEKNLRGMLDILKERKIPVLLCGMKSFRNLSLFGDKFQKVYKKLANEYDVHYYPFFLKDVAMESHLNQTDGLHPNAAGVKVIVDNIFPYVEDLIEE